MPTQVTLTGISDVFSAADIECLIRTAGEAVCGDLDDLSSLQRTLAERAYALMQAEDTDDPADLADDDTGDLAPARRSALITREYPVGSTARPETVRVRDAEVRVYNQDNGTGSDEASDMYVMEVLGVSLLIRARTGDPNNPDNPDSLFIHIDNEDPEPCTLAVEVRNSGETEYRI